LRWDRRALAAGIVAAAVLLGTGTRRRNEVYRSEIAFWEDVARKAPHNGRAFNNLGYAYALAARNDDAEEALRRAMALDPTDVRAAVNLRLLREGALASAERHP
jgi:Flp pilus assembly protein TadD